MKKKYIAPAASAVALALEDTVLTVSGPHVGIDETGTSVDDALTNKKYPWDNSSWDGTED